MSNILFFGDQTAEQYSLLKKIVLRQKSPLVATFFERVSQVLREEVSKLPYTQRATIPDFLTANDLVENYYQKGLKVPMVEGVMVTIAQLGHYIG